MRQLLIREQCLQREQKQHQDPQPMDEMEKQVMYFTVWAALLFTELKCKIVIFSTITIGQFKLADKEVKSGLHYLNENPLILLKFFKKYFRARS